MPADCRKRLHTAVLAALMSPSLPCRARHKPCDLRLWVGTAGHDDTRYAVRRHAIAQVFTDDQVSYTSWFLDAFNYAITIKVGAQVRLCAQLLAEGPFGGTAVPHNVLFLVF